MLGVGQYVALHAPFTARNLLFLVHLISFFFLKILVKQKVTWVMNDTTDLYL